MDKVLGIWKPPSITSYDVIRKLKKIYPGNKIGHCGTLDPFAEGILVVCIGKYTKNVSEIMSSKKVYEISLKFGFETDTLDSTGVIIREKNSETQISLDDIKTSISKSIGEIKQVPPYFSAKKINGVKP